MAKSASTLHDPLIKPEQDFLQNPYPTLNRLREEAPIFWSEKGEYWLVSTYPEAHSILGDMHFEKGPPKWRQKNIFAHIFKDGPLSQYGAKSMLNQNPPDHTRLRSLVNKAFTPSMINKMREHIEAIANELLDKVEAKKEKEMDLIGEFAYPLPAIVIAEMLGVPAADRDKFKGWSHAITAALDPAGPSVIDLAKVGHAYMELTGYLGPLIEARRHQKQQDLISALVEAEESGNHLSQTELLANIVLLLIAGHETTANLIGNGSYALLRNRDVFEDLKANMNLLPTAIQEFLRYDSPVQLVRRQADQEIELLGQKIAAEEQVVILLGGANRDPQEFENPEKLDIRRSKNKHLSFGHGIHHCLGSSLAAMEGEIAIRQLLERMPNLKLSTKSKKEPQYKLPFSLRGMKELQTQF
ncbi:MAG TPA: cytochrome P450 [Oculatellaceae cyanobacterium]